MGKEISMVQIRGLQKSYKSFKVLDGLDMTINKGDVYGFLGKNGFPAGYGAAF